jgi:predicted dehydrogenase
VTAARPLRWGVIGTGSIAASFVSDLKLTDSGEAVAVGSRLQSTADHFGDRYGVRNRHASYASVVEDPDVDVVYVATPHPLHRENAVLALRAGKPVLVEKAFAMNAAEARIIVDEARGAGLFAMEAMWTRFMPRVIEIRDIVARGELGEIVAVVGEFGVWFAPDPQTRWFAPELGGSAALDLGCYLVSFSSMLLGSPDRVLALVRPSFTGVDGQTSILLGHPNGSQAVLTCNVFGDGPKRVSVIGTEGRIDVDAPFYAPAGFTFLPRKGEPVRHEGSHEGGGWRHEADEVARCLAEGALESPLMPLDETISIMETLDAVLAQAGPTVELPRLDDRRGG